MKKTTWFRLVNSFILLPVTTMSGIPVGTITQATLNIVSPQAVLERKIDSDNSTNITKAEAIDKYFSSHNVPLEGRGMKMVIEAEKNGLDWRLIPAIAMRESTGGKHACKGATYNPFGWASCKIGFTSYDHSIEIVAKNLGGNNPRTAYHYAGKTLRGILNSYNPPSIVPKYADQVMAIMNTIGGEKASNEVALAI